MATDLEAVGVLADVVGVVDDQRAQPEYALLDFVEYRQLIRREWRLDAVFDIGTAQVFNSNRLNHRSPPRGSGGHAAQRLYCGLWVSVGQLACMADTRSGRTLELRPLLVEVVGLLG